MTIRELMNHKKGQYDAVELWTPFTDLSRAKRFHGDFIEPAEDADPETEVIEWELMTEDDYNNSILANGCEYADFVDEYGNQQAKVLCILISDDAARGNLSDRTIDAGLDILKGIDPAAAAAAHGLPAPDPLTAEQIEAIDYFNSLTEEERNDVIEIDGRRYVRKAYEAAQKRAAGIPVVTEYNYIDLASAAVKNPTDMNLAALAEWFEEYGSRFWTGECWEMEDGRCLYPVYADAELDENGEPAGGTWEVIGYEIR